MNAGQVRTVPVLTGGLVAYHNIPVLGGTIAKTVVGNADWMFPGAKGYLATALRRSHRAISLAGKTMAPPIRPTSLIVVPTHANTQMMVRVTMAAPAPQEPIAVWALIAMIV